MTTALTPPYPVLPPGAYNAMLRAAVGPDYSEGQPFFPTWTPNILSVGRYEIIPANFGQQGGARGDATNTETDGISHVVNASNPLRPSSLTHKPVWNVMVPTPNWQLMVLTKQQLATFENAQDIQAPQLPMVFAAPGTASLLK